MKETIKQKANKTRISLWVAECLKTKEYAGAAMVSGRTQAHFLRYGEIGVIEDFRRQRIASALYLAMTAQGILEGRRLFEITIVEDNPTQFFVLPMSGMKKVGELRHRTASVKTLVVFYFDLLDEGKFMQMVERVPDSITIEIVSNYYTNEMWEKNMEIYLKRLSDFVSKIEEMRRMIECGIKNITIKQGLTEAVNKSNKNNKRIKGLFDE